MSDSPFQQLVRELLKTTKRVDAVLTELKDVAIIIKAKYKPRAEFNRWRDSTDGKLWKQQKYKAQNGCCAICRQSIKLRSSHIDHGEKTGKVGSPPLIYWGEEADAGYFNTPSLVIKLYP